MVRQIQCVFLSTINLWQCPEAIFLHEMFYLRNNYHTQTGIRGIEHLPKHTLLWVTVTEVKHSELVVL